MEKYSKLLKKFNKLSQQVSNGIKEDITNYDRLKDKHINVKQEPRKFSRQSK